MFQKLGTSQSFAIGSFLAHFVVKIANDYHETHISIESIDFWRNLPRKFSQNWPLFIDCFRQLGPEILPQMCL